MYIFLTILLAGLVVAVGIALLRNRKTHVHARRTPAVPRQTGTLAHLQENKFFWGVEFSKPGCPESRELLGKQFPFDQAPTLPLPGCTQTLENCTCEFKGLRDRRSSHRRMMPDRRTEVRFSKSHPDRRTNAGRRRGDRWVHHSL